jgi:hypothetical protein
MLDDFKSYNASVDKEDDEKAKIDKLKEKIKLLIELTDPTLLNMDEEGIVLIFFNLFYICLF